MGRALAFFGVVAIIAVGILTSLPESERAFYLSLIGM